MLLMVYTVVQYTLPISHVYAIVVRRSGVWCGVAWCGVMCCGVCVCEFSIVITCAFLSSCIPSTVRQCETHPNTCLLVNESYYIRVQHLRKQKSLKWISLKQSRAAHCCLYLIQKTQLKIAWIIYSAYVVRVKCVCSQCIFF